MDADLLRDLSLYKKNGKQSNLKEKSVMMAARSVFADFELNKIQIVGIKIKIRINDLTSIFGQKRNKFISYLKKLSNKVNRFWFSFLEN